jgi:hypothetical protein
MRQFRGLTASSSRPILTIEPDLIRVLRILHAAQDWTRFFANQ